MKATITTIDFLKDGSNIDSLDQLIHIMRYLVVDASLNGTGIRDRYDGGFLAPEELHLSSETVEMLKAWVNKYETEHFDGYPNEKLIEVLDTEGRELAQIIKKELSEIKMEYYSDAFLKRESIE